SGVAAADHDDVEGVGGVMAHWECHVRGWRGESIVSGRRCGDDILLAGREAKMPDVGAMLRARPYTMPCLTACGAIGSKHEHPGTTPGDRTALSPGVRRVWCGGAVEQSAGKEPNSGRRARDHAQFARRRRHGRAPAGRANRRFVRPCRSVSFNLTFCVCSRLIVIRRAMWRAAPGWPRMVRAIPAISTYFMTARSVSRARGRRVWRSFRPPD